MEFYEAAREGLGAEFLAEIEAAVSLIEAHPLAWTALSPRTVSETITADMMTIAGEAKNIASVTDRVVAVAKAIIFDPAMIGGHG